MLGGAKGRPRSDRPDRRKLLTFGLPPVERQCGHGTNSITPAACSGRSDFLPLTSVRGCPCNCAVVVSTNVIVVPSVRAIVVVLPAVVAFANAMAASFPPAAAL